MSSMNSPISTRQRLIDLEQMIKQLRNEIHQGESEYAALPHGPDQKRRQDMLRHRINSTRTRLTMLVMEQVKAQALHRREAAESKAQALHRREAVAESKAQALHPREAQALYQRVAQALHQREAQAQSQAQRSPNRGTRSRSPNRRTRSRSPNRGTRSRSPNRRTRSRSRNMIG